MPFDELKQKSDITQRAIAVKRVSDFSAKIREGLPGRGEPALRVDPQSAESRRP
jgi:hypothetical protein